MTTSARRRRTGWRGLPEPEASSYEISIRNKSEQDIRSLIEMKNRVSFSMIATVLIFVLLFGSTEQVYSKAHTPEDIYYFENFNGFPRRRLPGGWLHRSTGEVKPTIEEYGGYGPDYRLVSFPEVGWEYWDCWALRDGITASGSYIAQIKLNFQNSIADRAGLTIAWDDTVWDRIDIQPNVSRNDIEFRVTYTGSVPYNLVIETLADITVNAHTDYWLKIFANDYGPGYGVVDVFWSTDSITFIHVLHVTGIPNLTGLIGMSTAGPSLPHTHFDDFLIYTPAHPANIP